MTVLPTELVGSYALPSWLLIAEERLEQAGDLGEADVAELLEDAVKIAVFDQERAGLDVLTDGEMYRRDFIQSFYDRLTGLRSFPPLRRFGAAGYDQNPRYAAIEKVAAPDGLGIVAEFALLRSLTHKALKVCVPGPITLALPLTVARGGHYADKGELLADVAAIVNQEMKSLVAAGADYIQVDEPRYVTSHQDASELVALFNQTRQGVDARVGLHLCFGNFRGRSRDRRDYSQLFPGLLEARADQFSLEFANREFHQIELLEHLSLGQRVGVGVIDVKSYFVETPAEVAASIRLALQHADPASVVVTTDCGFNHTPRHIAFEKMKALAEGAAIARDEL